MYHIYDIYSVPHTVWYVLYLPAPMYWPAAGLCKVGVLVPARLPGPSHVAERIAGQRRYVHTVCETVRVREVCELYVLYVRCTVSCVCTVPMELFV